MTEHTIYIGIDDTDNLETRGTGFRARELMGLIEENGLATGLAVTRHQLLVDDRVPYTSHNSSACLVVEPLGATDMDRLMDFCRDYLLDIAADGSDVGLCVADYEQAQAVTGFGLKAKTELVYQDEARQQAARHNIRLEGLTGDFQGIIGSLSAVGLHVHGNDGRYLWPRDIREFAGQAVPMSVVRACKGIEQITFRNGEEVTEAQTPVQLGMWPRTVRINHKAVLLVEKIDADQSFKVLEKEAIKSIRP